MKNVKTMTAREFAKFILDHKEDIIEFATTKDNYNTPLESIDDCSGWWFVQPLIYPQYQSYNIFIDYCGGGYGVAYSYDDVDFTVDNIQKDLKEWMQGIGTDDNDNKEPIVYVDISPYIKIECVEICPHCGEEVEINWCTKEDGYEIYCPYCGKKMLLCDECMHSPDNKTQNCDWCEETGCFRNKK